MDIHFFTILKLIIFIVSKFILSAAQDFNNGFCSNPQCSEPVAIGYTTIDYKSIEPYKLSFRANEEVIIFVKEFGPKNDLLGVMINGIKGYVNKRLVMEQRVIAKDLVAASVDFMQPQIVASSYHISSHVHVSSHFHRDDASHSVQHSVPNIDPHSSQHFHHEGYHLDSSRQQDPIHNHHHHSSSNDMFMVSDDDSHNYYDQKESGAFVSNQAPSSHVHLSLEYSRTLTPIQSQEQINTAGHFMQTPNSPQLLESQFQNPSGIQEPNQWSGINPDHLSSSFSHDHASHSSNQIFSDSLASGNLESQIGILTHSHVPQSHIPQESFQNQIQPSHSFIPESNFQNRMPSVQPQSFIPEINLQNQKQFSHSESYMSAPNFPEQMQLAQSQSYTPEVNIPNQIQSSQSKSYLTNDQNQIHSVQSQPYIPESNTQSQIQPSQSFYTSNDFDLHSNQELDGTMAMLKNLGYNAEGDLTNDPNPNNQINPSVSIHESNSQDIPGSEFSKRTLDVTAPSRETDPLKSNKRQKILKMKDKLKDGIDGIAKLAEEFENDIGNMEKEKLDSISFNGIPSSKSDEKQNIQDKVETIVKTTENFEKDIDFKEKEQFSSTSINEVPDSNKNMDVLQKDFNENSDQSDIPTNKQKVTTSKIPQAQIDRTISNEQELSTPNLSHNNEITPTVSHINNSLEKLPEDFSEVKEAKSKSLEENKNIEISELNNSTSASDDRIDDLLSYREENVSADIQLNNDDKEDLEQLNKEEETEEETEDYDDYEDMIIEKNNSSDIIDDIKSDSSNLEAGSEFVNTSKDSDISNVLNTSGTIVTENTEGVNAYQTRHLKDIENNNENPIPVEENEQIEVSWEFNIYTSFENSLDAIRSFIEAILPWIPDPLYTIITDLEKDGISPKVPVFTALSAVPCIVLMVFLVYIKEKSKEKKLVAQLTISEKTLYNLKAEKTIFEEKLEKAEIELQILRTLIEEEKLTSAHLKAEVDSLKEQGEEANIEIDKSIDTIEALKVRELQFMALVKDHEKEHVNLLKQKTGVDNKLLDQENAMSNLSKQLEEKNAEIQKLLDEKTEDNQTLEDYQEKLSLLQQNCNQLLQEAEVWNLRVKELSDKLSEETSIKEEQEKSLDEKNNEIEALTQAIQVFKSFEEIGKEEEEYKSIEEKLQYIINSTSILIKLQKQEENNNLLSERLSEEKNKLLDMEVVILDIKSENDKLRLNYNQALQDRTEAQTKLDVLTNYFKDKEIQLQKQLGVQEAVRQKTEEDASSAERRICLIEQENASYKYQVATMKQEMEETERNLKSQIATQEKKAHENWLAARTAERKLEDTKQEVMQLRQRLTLLEREQENWLNSRDEIIRPVPKRISNANDDTVLTHDSNSSIDIRQPMFPPPPMMLPSDRPLPPLPPPYLPPFEPMPHFRPPPPWLPPPDSISNPDYRMTPEFGRGRELTPPRGRNSVGVEGDIGPRQSSPITDLRDSRNSTPPHLLPDFHDIPPHPPRPPFFPPMGPRTRFPPPPGVFRRDIPGQRRHENQDDNPNYGPQHQSGPPDNWRNPRV